MRVGAFGVSIGPYSSCSFLAFSLSREFFEWWPNLSQGGELIRVRPNDAHDGHTRFPLRKEVQNGLRFRLLVNFSGNFPRMPKCCVASCSFVFFETVPSLFQSRVLHGRGAESSVGKCSS